jgi:glycosyltransferase involved in cell wall biosynthesis
LGFQTILISNTAIQTLLEEPMHSVSTLDGSRKQAIRVLALVEAETVNGPVKNLLTFYRSCQVMDAPSGIEMSLAAFERLRGKQSAAAQRPNEFLEAASKAGIQVDCIRESFAFDLRVIWRLRKIVKQVNPDIIQTHFSKSHFLVWLAGVWRGRPWIAFHHGHTRSAFRLRVYHGLDRWSLRFPRQIIAVSQAFAAQLAAQGLRREKITVLHNAVELPTAGLGSDAIQLQAVRARLGIRPTDRVVLAIGRLSKEKAHADLVAALACLLQLKPELRVQLVILGEGPERASIAEAVRAAGLQDVVKMPGHVSDVNEYYEMADLMVISSVSEGSPNVLLEAMAAGVPVVATSVGGIPEIAKDQEQALLVPPRDPAAMAQAIDALLSNPEAGDRLATAARTLAATRYSPEQRALWLVRLYGSVLAKWQLQSGSNTKSSAVNHQGCGERNG